MTDEIKQFLNEIEYPKYRERMSNLLLWIENEYPKLTLAYKWKQPMFLDHGVFIIGFSVSKKHIAIAPEKYAMIHFDTDIKSVGYDQSMMMFRIKWDEDIHYELLKKIIDYKIDDRRNETRFWK